MKTMRFLGVLLSILIFNSSCENLKKGKVQAEYEISTEFKEVEDALHFYVLGDWGRNGEYHQRDLANMMNKAGKVVEPEFIISTGDNIYPNGVESVNDPLWKSAYEDVYNGHSLSCPWYVVLGNHDVRGNAQAQIDYTQVSRRWNMPDKYFVVDKYVDEDEPELGKARFVYIDTNPFELKYYSEDKYKKYVTQQDTAAQLRWMDSVLTHTDADWKIVVGHHPMYSGGKRVDATRDVREQLEPHLKRLGVDIYFAGHEHDLQHIKPDGNLHHIVSGAGSETRKTGMMEYSIFAKSIQGFVSASLTKEQIYLQFVDYMGNVLYSTTIDNNKTE